MGATNIFVNTMAPTLLTGQIMDECNVGTHQPVVAGDC